MAQKIFGLGLGGSGIVGVLIAAGIIIMILDPQSNYSNLFLGSGFGIGIILGLLGIFAVAKKVMR
jgi:hypothetical protein